MFLDGAGQSMEELSEFLRSCAELRGDRWRLTEIDGVPCCLVALGGVRRILTKLRGRAQWRLDELSDGGFATRASIIFIYFSSSS